MDKNFFIKNLLNMDDSDGENEQYETASNTLTFSRISVEKQTSIDAASCAKVRKANVEQISTKFEDTYSSSEDDELRLASGAQIAGQLPDECQNGPLTNVKPIVDISRLLADTYFVDPPENLEPKSKSLENADDKVSSYFGPGCLQELICLSCQLSVRSEEQFTSHEVRESTSINSYYVQLKTPSRLSLHLLSSMCPDETYTLYDKIDQSGHIALDQQQLPAGVQFGERLLSLLHNKHAGDLKVYIGENKFRCHLCVLQMYSNYFKRCQTEDAYKIRLPAHKLTARAFYIIYNWMLQDKPVLEQQLSNRFLLEVHQAAQFLDVSELVMNTWTTLNVRENEAFKLLPDMVQLDVPECETVLFSRISRFFLTLVSSQEFVELNESYVCRLLSSNNLGVNSEIEIFYAAVRWLSHKWPERQAAIAQLFSCVRFGLMSPIFLRFLQNQQTTQVLHAISQNSLVKEWINKAFIFFSTELYCKDTAQKLPFKLPKYECPVERKWLFDGNCGYHQTQKCCQRQFFSYEQFLGYLITLHETGPDYWQRLPYLEKVEVS